MAVEKVMDELAGLVKLVDPKLLFAKLSERDQQSRFPRLSWRPAGFAHSNAQGSRGDLYTREWSIVIEAWGEDLEQAEQVMDLFVAVARAQLSQPGHQLASGQVELGGATSKQAVLRMTFLLKVPVQAQPAPIRVITDINTTGDFVEPPPASGQFVGPGSPP